MASELQSLKTFRGGQTKEEVLGLLAYMDLDVGLAALRDRVTIRPVDHTTHPASNPAPPRASIASPRAVEDLSLTRISNSRATMRSGRS
jgi:hypothetical protein